jgi:succinyl-diaminopimelate desuccinylase
MTATDRAELDRIRERLVALTRDLMLVPSIPSRPEDIRHCFGMVRNHLEAIGGVSVTPYEDGGYPSLVATPSGCDWAEVLILAHLDVIAHPDHSVYTSEVREGRIYGPGAGDMKGQLAIALEVFRAILRRDPNAAIGLAVTSDEEIGGESGAGYLFGRAGLRCGLALIPDGGSLTQVTVEEKGILHLEVTSRGKAGHAARPWLAENAVERLIEGLQRVRARFADGAAAHPTWRPTCSVTLVSTTNQTINRVPSEACSTLDIRFPAPHTADSIEAEVSEALGPEIAARRIIAAEATRLQPDELYLEVTREITGVLVDRIRDDGGSDARFLAAQGIPVIMSRPKIGNLHARDEWIDIESMVTFYRIYQEYLLRKLRIEVR